MNLDDANTYQSLRFMISPALTTFAKVNYHNEKSVIHSHNQINQSGMGNFLKELNDIHRTGS